MSIERRNFEISKMNLSENDSCDKITFGDEGIFFINEGKIIGENAHIISSSESSSSDYKLKENIPSKKVHIISSSEYSSSDSELNENFQVNGVQEFIKLQRIV
jgi:hypothetical protein